MNEQLYRRSNRRVVSPAVLRGSKFCRVRVQEPEHPDLPEGEWYCPNPDCVVRQCMVRCKLRGAPMPTMGCPACAGAMQFQHWLAEEMLEPVPSNGFLGPRL